MDKPVRDRRRLADGGYQCRRYWSEAGCVWLMERRRACMAAASSKQYAVFT
jgi:hypothetical protein